MNLREKLLAKTTFQKKIVEIPDGPDGSVLKVLIQQLSIAQKNELAGEFDASGKPLIGGSRISRMTVQCIIQCALDPDTGKPLFGPADDTLLLNAPSNSWVETLAGEILTLTSQAATEAKN